MTTVKTEDKSIFLHPDNENGVPTATIEVGETFDYEYGEDDVLGEGTFMEVNVDECGAMAALFTKAADLIRAFKKEVPA